MAPARRSEAAVVGEVNEELYSTPEDALATTGALGLGGRGRYILAAAFAMCTMSAAGPDESGVLGTAAPYADSHAR